MKMAGAKRVQCNENGAVAKVGVAGAGSANNCCQTVFHEKCAQCIGSEGGGVGGRWEGNCVVYAWLLRLSSSAIACAVDVVGLDMPLVAMHANKI